MAVDTDQHKVFISYNFDDELFVLSVVCHLRRQPGLDPYFYSDEVRAKAWTDQIENELKSSRCFILFVGETLGDVQTIEATEAQAKDRVTHGYKMLRVNLPSASNSLPKPLEPFGKHDPICVNEIDEHAAVECAKTITERLNLNKVFITEDGLPFGYPYDYEKHIVEAYQKAGTLDSSCIDSGWRKKLLSGVPPSWPQATNLSNDSGSDDEVTEEGMEVRSKRTDNRIIVNAMMPKPNGSQYEPLTFLEARRSGAQHFHLKPGRDELQVGILVSGGIAPGINAVIAGIVDSHLNALRRHESDPDKSSFTLKIWGYRNGFLGFLGGADRIPLLTTDEETGDLVAAPLVMENDGVGGAIIGTSRLEELLPTSDPVKRKKKLKAITNKLIADGINIFYIIGGDGSMKAAHAIATGLRNQKNETESLPISIAAIPKTMDNDILWVWQAFGFMSAVDKATQFAVQLHREAKSNPRLCVMQLFGSDSGFVVSHAALACNVCDLALIPEVAFDMDSVFDYIKDFLLRKNKKKHAHGLILMGETAIPKDAKKYYKKEYVGLTGDEKKAIDNFLSSHVEGTEGRVFGQTSDELRSASLKIVSRVIQKRIEEEMGGGSADSYWNKFYVFTNEPRHLIRAVNPSPLDEIFAHRLGTLAVENALAGYTDFMVSQWLTEYVVVPLQLVVLGRKRIYKHGRFWQSVVAATGQPEKLTKVSTG